MTNFIKTRGGKRAIALTWLTAVQVPISSLRRFVALPTRWAPPRRLVFVCAGNICRSPFAEQLARRQGVHAVSMGLHARQGAPAHPDAVSTGLAFRIDLSAHVATPFDPAQVQDGDLVLGFELTHVLALERALRGRRVEVRLLGAFVGPAHFHLHDPYGLGKPYFQRCFARVERCTLAASRLIEREGVSP